MVRPPCSLGLVGGPLDGELGRAESAVDRVGSVDVVVDRAGPMCASRSSGQRLASRTSLFRRRHGSRGVAGGAMAIGLVWLIWSTRSTRPLRLGRPIRAVMPIGEVIPIRAVRQRESGWW